MAKKNSLSELEETYEKNDFKVNQERNDFLLPQITYFVKKKQWINTKPEYQRRLVWDRKKKSRLIESLLMNVPVPQIFLFEHELSRYEVMDGQQRLNAVLEFYNNEFKLTGLEYWKELNGYNYADLPPKIQRGLDRRRISATVLLNESGGTPKAAQELRRQIFDRLNTGGQKLNAQELRNCLYSGPFNDLTIELAGDSLFNDMWGVPRYSDNIRKGQISQLLKANKLFQRMGDVEVVLRFFAFKGVKSKITGAVTKILDRRLDEGKLYSKEMLEKERKSFYDALSAAHDVFGDDAFKLPHKDGSYGAHSKPLYDSIMVAFHRLSAEKSKLVARKAKLKQAVTALVTKSPANHELFTAKANTAGSIRERLDLMEAAFRSVV